jgi:hypothetical protein
MRISPGAAAKAVRMMKAAETYVLALATVAPDGKTLYAGTGGRRRACIAWHPMAAVSPKLIYEAEGSVTALTVAPDGPSMPGAAPGGL